MKLFKKRYKHPTARGIYAVTHGPMIGQFFVFIKEDKNNLKDTLSAMAMPEMEIHYIAKEELKKGLETKVLEHVEELPIDLYDKIQKEFFYRKDLKAKKETEKQNELDTRRRQLTLPNVLDSKVKSSSNS